jgi:hypothetical protein
LNTKKTIYLILFVLLASMLAVGCTGSNNEKNASQAANTPSQDQASSPQPTQAVYQDAEWNASVHKQYAIMKTDFDAMATATNNSDTDAITKYGQNIMDDAKKAIEENDKYNLSPKFQDSQNKWRSALQDCNYAGQYWIMTAKDIKNGNITSTNLTDIKNGDTTPAANLIKAGSCTGSGTYNMKRVIDFLGSP